MSLAPRQPSRRDRTRRAASAAVLATLLQACAGLPSLPRTPDLSDGGDDILSLPAATEPVPQGAGAVPLDDGADWIQLKSGEWLRGQLLRIRDGLLEFDSDELGERSFDTAKVSQIRTASPQIVVTPDSKSLRGKLALQGDQVWVAGEQTVQLGREDIFASLAFDGVNPVDWAGKLTLGATLRSGNTSQNDFTAFAELVRETARTRWISSYNGTLSEAQSVETNNNHRLRSAYDLSVTRRLFLTLPKVEAYVDRFQNLEYRLTASLPIGYELLDTARHDWRVSLGPAYQLTQFDTVLAGQDQQDGTFAATVSSQYAWDVTDSVDFEFDYAITTPLPDTEEYNHNLVLRVSVDLVANLQLDIAFVWDRVNAPISDGGGVLPEPDDYRTTIGLGWSF